MDESFEFQVRLANEVSQRRVKDFYETCELIVSCCLLAHALAFFLFIFSFHCFFSLFLSFWAIEESWCQTIAL